MKSVEMGMCCALSGCAVNNGINYKIPSLWLKAYNLDKEIEHHRLTGDQIRQLIWLTLIQKGIGIHWRIKGIMIEEKNKQKSRQKVPWPHRVNQKWGAHWKKGATPPLHCVSGRGAPLRSLCSTVNWDPHLWVPFLKKSLFSAFSSPKRLFHLSQRTTGGLMR